MRLNVKQKQNRKENQENNLCSVTTNIFATSMYKEIHWGYCITATSSRFKCFKYLQRVHLFLKILWTNYKHYNPSIWRYTHCSCWKVGKQFTDFPPPPPQIKPGNVETCWKALQVNEPPISLLRSHRFHLFLYNLQSFTSHFARHKLEPMCSNYPERGENKITNFLSFTLCLIFDRAKSYLINPRRLYQDWVSRLQGLTKRTKIGCHDTIKPVR